MKEKNTKIRQPITSSALIFGVTILCNTNVNADSAFFTAGYFFDDLSNNFSTADSSAFLIGLGSNGIADAVTTSGFTSGDDTILASFGFTENINGIFIDQITGIPSGAFGQSFSIRWFPGVDAVSELAFGAAYGDIGYYGAPFDDSANFTYQPWLLPSAESLTGNALYDDFALVLTDELATEFGLVSGDYSSFSGVAQFSVIPEVNTIFALFTIGAYTILSRRTLSRRRHGCKAMGVKI